MEEGDGVAAVEAAASGMAKNSVFSSSEVAGADANNVDLVSRIQTLSSNRKKIMTKYFTLDEEDSWPLFSEYFAVALAFVALGAMVRETNLRTRKEEESPDRVPTKLQRMALDTMLKSSMDRLRGLARRTQTLEEKARERYHVEAAFQFERLEFLKRVTSLEATIAQKAEAEAAWVEEKEDLHKRVAEADAQRGYFFKRMAEAEALLAELQRLRTEDGKANARLVGIYAGREQAWKSEKTKMKHEIELLTEKIARVVSQAQIKYCHSCSTAMEALKVRNLKRRAKEFVREKVITERDHSVLSIVEQTHKSELDSSPPRKFFAIVEGHGESGETDSYDSSTSQHEETEDELKSIFKRVGVLKRRGGVGSGLNKLLNEAAVKPKANGAGFVDVSFKKIISNGSVEFGPEHTNVIDTTVDNECPEEYWQVVESQAGDYVQTSHGPVDELEPKRSPVDRSLINFTSFAHSFELSNGTESLETIPDDEALVEDNASRRNFHSLEWLSVASNGICSGRDPVLGAFLNSNLPSEHEIDKEVLGRNLLKAEGVKVKDYHDALTMSFEEYKITRSGPENPAIDAQAVGSVSTLKENTDVSKAHIMEDRNPKPCQIAVGSPRNLVQTQAATLVKASDDLAESNDEMMSALEDSVQGSVVHRAGEDGGGQIAKSENFKTSLGENSEKVICKVPSEEHEGIELHQETAVEDGICSNEAGHLEETTRNLTGTVVACRYDGVVNNEFAKELTDGISAHVASGRGESSVAAEKSVGVLETTVTTKITSVICEPGALEWGSCLEELEACVQTYSEEGEVKEIGVFEGETTNEVNDGGICTDAAQFFKRGGIKEVWTDVLVPEDGPIPLECTSSDIKLVDDSVFTTSELSDTCREASIPEVYATTLNSNLGGTTWETSVAGVNAMSGKDNLSAFEQSHLQLLKREVGAYEVGSGLGCHIEAEGMANGLDLQVPSLEVLLLNPPIVPLNPVKNDQTFCDEDIEIEGRTLIFRETAIVKSNTEALEVDSDEVTYGQQGGEKVSISCLGKTLDWVVDSLHELDEANSCHEIDSVELSMKPSKGCD